MGRMGVIRVRNEQGDANVLIAYKMMEDKIITICFKTYETFRHRACACGGMPASSLPTGLWPAELHVRTRMDFAADNGDDWCARKLGWRLWTA
jgi:hypothetical protein